MIRSTRCKFFLLIVFLLQTLCWAEDSTPSGKAMYEGLRSRQFMREWLIGGPFPLTLSSELLVPGETDGRRNPYEVKLQTEALRYDFLKEHGGEAQIVPTEGMTHTFGDQTYTWKYNESKGNNIDFTISYNNVEYAIAYAYAEVVISEATQVILALGSDDGVQVWLNGEKVHDRWAARSLRPDEDWIPVSLRTGVNRLLIKVQNLTRDWGFSARFYAMGDIEQSTLVSLQLENLAEDPRLVPVLITTGCIFLGGLILVVIAYQLLKRYGY